MIRATQSGAPEAVSSRTVAPGAAPPAGGAASIEAALFAAAAAAGPQGPGAEEVVRFAQALAAVRAGQLAAAGTTSDATTSPQVIAGAPVPAAMHPAADPDRGLFVAPSWLRTRLESAPVPDAVSPASTPDDAVPLPRRAPAAPALAEFGAPPWLKSPPAVIDRAVSVPQMISEAMAPPVPRPAIPVTPGAVPATAGRAPAVAEQPSTVSTGFPVPPSGPAPKEARLAAPAIATPEAGSPGVPMPASDPGSPTAVLASPKVAKPAAGSPRSSVPAPGSEPRAAGRTAPVVETSSVRSSRSPEGVPANAAPDHMPADAIATALASTAPRVAQDAAPVPAPVARGPAGRRPATSAGQADGLPAGKDLPALPVSLTPAPLPVVTAPEADASAASVGTSLEGVSLGGRSRLSAQSLAGLHAHESLASGEAGDEPEGAAGGTPSSATTGGVPSTPPQPVLVAAPGLDPPARGHVADRVASMGSPPLRDDGGSAPVVAGSGSTPDVRPQADAAPSLPFGPVAPERAPPVEVRSIPVDVAAPQWPKAVAAELVMLGHQKVESATLRLSPEHLGHIEVQIHLDAKVINLTFGAAHADTRSALEHALPQLREGFAQAGLTLGEATVHQQMRQESQNETVVRGPDLAPPEEVAAKSEHRQALSLVDEYA